MKVIKIKKKSNIDWLNKDYNNKNSEIIKVIATKEKIDFLPHLKTIDNPEELEIAGGMAVFKSSNMAIKELAHWLVKIKPDQRTDDLIIYEVHRR